jgi:hypothetical protein
VAVIMKIMEGNYYLFAIKATQVVIVKDFKNCFAFIFNSWIHYVDSLDLDLFMLIIINIEKFMGSSYHINFLSLKLTGL